MEGRREGGKEGGREGVGEREIDCPPSSRFFVRRKEGRLYGYGLAVLA